MLLNFSDNCPKTVVILGARTAKAPGTGHLPNKNSYYGFQAEH